MNKLRWWFRIVGLFYCLLGVVWSPALGVTSLARTIFPNYDAPIGGVADRFLFNVGVMVGLEWLVLGAYMLYASRNPSKHLNIVWLVISFELVRGILDDLFLIVQGYPALSYIAWIIVHILIIVTGFIFAQSASALRSVELSAPAKA